MSTRLQIILVSIIALMAGLGFTATQLVLSKKSENIQNDLTEKDTHGSTDIKNEQQKERTIKSYFFECQSTDGLTNLYRLYSNGDRELVSEHLESAPQNQHRGDCFQVKTSDKGADFKDAKRLYLIQCATDSDAGCDGYYEFDLLTKALKVSQIQLSSMFNFSSAPEDERYRLSFSEPDKNGEVRSLELIDFTDDVTSTIGKLPEQYSYVSGRYINDFAGSIDPEGEINWMQYDLARVSVYSASDDLEPCGSSGPNPCKIRVPIFRQEFDLSAPEVEAKIQ